MRIIWLTSLAACLLIGTDRLIEFHRILNLGEYGICKQAFCDLEVYLSALERYRSGELPYVYTDELIFVYPPAFIYLFSFIGAQGFLATYIAGSTISLALLLRNAPKRAVAALVIIAPSGGLAFAVLSGNIAFPAHLAIIALAYVGVESGRWRGMIAATCFVALMKPYFLAYLVLPALASPRERRLQMAGDSTVGFAAFLVILGATTFVRLDLAEGFFLALQTQVLDNGDRGTSLQNALDQMLGSPLLALAMHSAFFAATFWVAVTCAPWIQRTVSSTLTVDETRVALLCIAAILCNPRLKHYDYAASDILGSRCS